jgi:hypothetical protein
MIEVGEPDYFPVDDLNKLHPPACDGCRLRGPCPGLYRGYHEVHGDAELRPARRPARQRLQLHPRSSHLSPQDMSDDAHCPLRDGPLGVTPWDRGRDLFVRHHGKLARYRADTRDFSDAEIAAIKHAARPGLPRRQPQARAPTTSPATWSPSPAPPSAPAARTRPTCTGLYEPVLEDIFTRDDALVRAHLAELRGELLDLGCGEAPYADALAPALAAGQPALPRPRPRSPPASPPCASAGTTELIAGAADQLADPPSFGLHDRRFDHLTILRSWNHLPRPRRRPRPSAPAPAPRRHPHRRRQPRLRPRPHRRPGAPRRASTAGWEHHRSDDAAEAAPHPRRRAARPPSPSSRAATSPPAPATSGC